MATAADPRPLTREPAPRQARGVWALRDRPGVLWLTLALLVTGVHPWVPEATWLMTHLVLLGALTHSAMVWSTHFAATVLKSPPTIDDRRQQSRRLLLLLVGTAAVLIGVPTTWWWLTVTGAIVVSTAVVWHAVQLVRRLRRALPGRFRVTVRYYVAAAACLPVGATFGVLLARQPADPWHGRLIAAHVAVMALGWLGLTMTGTLVTLWPTMLRTRMDDRAERLARQALPGFVVALTGVIVTAMLGEARGVAVGLVAWLAAFAWWGRALTAPLRRRLPREFAAASVGMALVWLTGGLLGLAVTLATADDVGVVSGVTGRIAAVVAAGFGLQLVTGALSHLMPSVLGGGPSVVRAGQAWLERGALLRLTTINAGLMMSLLPVPSVVRVVTTSLVLLAFAAFLPLMLRGIRASITARRAVTRGETVDAPPPPAWHIGQAAAAIAVLALGASLATTLAAGATRDLSSGVTPTGHTTTVRVEAKDMRFHPSSVSVPAGDRLVVEVVNADAEDTHDLVFANGAHTPRLAPGESATVDVGVIGQSDQGWCSVVGHRRMGMVLDVVVEGSPADSPVAATDHGDTGGHVMSGTATPAASAAYDARLAPAPRTRVHHVDITIDETVLEVAPGVWQRRWTFNGTTPGPTLRGRLGDRFVVRVHNAAEMTHSIDFHAGERAPDRVMRAIPPGGSLTYRFTARRAGIWMYHCSTMPMATHIGAGLFGAVVIDPPDLRPVDHEWVLIGSETFLGDDTSRESASEVDDAAVAAEQPDLTSFNGRADQYDAAPLRVRVGERIRLWVLAAGPNRLVSFHVVGGQFDAVYDEGAWQLRDGSPGGAQVLPLLPAQGGFVEMTFREPGRYPFVNHLMVDGERGQHGVIEVTR